MMGHDHYEARAPLVGASDRRLQLSPTMAKVAAVALGLAFSGMMRSACRQHHHPHPQPALAAGAEIALFGPGVESGDFDPDDPPHAPRLCRQHGAAERAKAYYEDARCSRRSGSCARSSSSARCPSTGWRSAVRAGDAHPLLRRRARAPTRATSGSSCRSSPTCSSERCRLGSLVRRRLRRAEGRRRPPPVPPAPGRGAAGDHPRRVEGGVLEDGVSRRRAIRRAIRRRAIRRNSPTLPRPRRYAGRHVLWVCDDAPRMLHHANINTSNGRYYLGNVFNEPIIHARNNMYDYVSVYGSLAPGKPFGFRQATTSTSPSCSTATAASPTSRLPRPQPAGRAARVAADEGQRGLANWKNSAGIPQFPDAVRVMLRASSATRASRTSRSTSLRRRRRRAAHAARRQDDRRLQPPRPREGVGGDFDAVWALIDYTLDSRAARGRATPSAPRSEGGKLDDGEGAGPAADGARAVGEPDLLLRAGGDGGAALLRARQLALLAHARDRALQPLALDPDPEGVFEVSAAEDIYLYI